MYSGITQGLFNVSRVHKKPGITDYAVMLNPTLISGLQVGASVNIDGVCQTVTQIAGNEVFFTAIAETLQLTTLDTLEIGRKVSVERSIRVGDEIGGHLVAGHVIGTAVIERIQRRDNNVDLTIRCPADWMKYILPKGFIAVDGSSLTVGHTDPSGVFDLHLIPETLRLTNLGNKNLGDRVNIELDHNTQIIVSTAERILEAYYREANSEINDDFKTTTSDGIEEDET